MHEYSLCQSLLNQVLETAQRHKAQAVKSIDVQLRPLSGVSAEQLSSAFLTARSDTVAAQANLHIEELPLQFRCCDCNAEYNGATAQLECPNCDSVNTQLLSADGLLITNVELLL